MKKIFFPGSFNPFTAGHADILNRLLKMADRVTVGIGVNTDKPSSAESAEKNAEEIRKYLADNKLDDRVEVITYSGLTGEKAVEAGACCMARGVRSASDFDYEYTLASANRDAFGIETILIPADPALSFVSSTIIRDLKKHGRDDIASRYLANR